MAASNEASSQKSITCGPPTFSRLMLAPSPMLVKKAIISGDCSVVSNSKAGAAIGDAQQTDLLYGAITMLNPIERALVTLYLEDLSYEEMSDILGLSKANPRKVPCRTVGLPQRAGRRVALREVTAMPVAGGAPLCNGTVVLVAWQDG